MILADRIKCDTKLQMMDVAPPTQVNKVTVTNRVYYLLVNPVPLTPGSYEDTSVGKTTKTTATPETKKWNTKALQKLGHVGNECELGC
jgi:hypothetical protein